MELTNLSIHYLKFLLFSFGILFSNTTSSQNWKQDQKILVTPVEAYNQFGHDLALFDSMMIVGQPVDDADSIGKKSKTGGGSCLIYRLDSNGKWGVFQKLISKDVNGSDNAGYSVGIYGNYCISGAPYQDENSDNSKFNLNGGASYIFQLNKHKKWGQIQKIAASDQSQDDNFGFSSSIFDSIIVVGARRHGYKNKPYNFLKYAGAAYVFELQKNGTWIETEKLTAKDRTAGDYFGFSVCLHKNTIVVGAPLDAQDENGYNILTDAGSAYIYEKNNSGRFVQTQKIASPHRSSGGLFGDNVIINDSFLVVGAKHESEDENKSNFSNKSGAVYIFKKNKSTSWRFFQKLVPLDRGPEMRFGASLAIQDSVLVVGSYSNETDKHGNKPKTYSGAAYIFKLNSKGRWYQTDKIVSKDRTNTDYFSSGVAIHNNKIAVGAKVKNYNNGSIQRRLAGAVYSFIPCKEIRDTLEINTCYRYVSPSKKYNWVNSGIYYDTILKNDECTQYYTIKLNIKNNSDSTIYVSTCDSFISPSGNYTWKNSGTYQDVIPNFYGCDSFININLKIRRSSKSSQTIKTCYQYTSPSGKYIWDSSGQYVDTILNKNNCDSIITTNLTIFRKSVKNISYSACDSMMSRSWKYVWRESGIYYDTLINARGCDSILIVNLTINSHPPDTLLYSTCKPVLSPSKNYIYNFPGTYFDTIQNSSGCDSFIVLVVQKVRFNKNVIQIGNRLESNDKNSNYQWINCKDTSIIPNKTNISFMPEKSGWYAVVLEKGGCLDTSSCYYIKLTDILNLEIKNLANIYPNPANEYIKIEVLQPGQITYCYLSNVVGEKIDSKHSLTNNIYQIRTPLVPGIYYANFRLKSGKMLAKKIVIH